MAGHTVLSQDRLNIPAKPHQVGLRHCSVHHTQLPLAITRALGAMHFQLVQRQTQRRFRFSAICRRRFHGIRLTAWVTLATGSTLCRTVPNSRAERCNQPDQASRVKPVTVSFHVACAVTNCAGNGAYAECVRPDLFYRTHSLDRNRTCSGHTAIDAAPSSASRTAAPTTRPPRLHIT